MKGLKHLNTVLTYIFQNAPTQVPYDQFDCLGSSPYTTEEMREGKIWMITYATEDRSSIEIKDKEQAKNMSMDFGNDEVQKKILAGAATEGKKAVETVTKDLEQVVARWAKTEWTMEERFTASPPVKLNSFVVKLNSGSLLLYAPVRVRDELEFGVWLEQLGKVAWVVVASSYHTLFLPSILARFPEARVVAAPQAQDKLNHVKALVRGKVDYDSTCEEEMGQANRQLEEEGVRLFNVKGDVMTNVILAVAHGVLLTCDLIYNRHDGGIFHVSREEFDEYKEELAGLRLFKYLSCNKPNSPNGFLATYR